MAKGRILTKLTLSELSGVDDPCQEHAKVSIMKRRPRAPGPGQIAKLSFREALTGSLLADQVRETFYNAFDNLYEGKEAFRTAVIDELSSGGDGSVASADFKAWLNSLVDQAVGAAKAAGAAKIDPAELTKSFNTAADAWLESRQQEKPMFKFTTKAALQAAIAKFAPATSTFQDVIDIQDSADQLGETASLPATLAKAAPPADVTALQKQVKVLSLDADLRKHYDGLAADKQDAFLAKDAAGQKAEVAALNQDDPVVHTMTDGTEVRKSAGAFAVSMAKQMDAQAATIKRLTEAGGEAAIEKALAKYPNVSATVAKRLIKSAEGGSDADKAEVEQTLTAMNKAAGPLFKRVGTGGGGIDIDKGLDTPEGQMGAIVKRIAKEKNISEAHATVEAVTDPEYQAAYAKSLDAVPPVAAYAPGS